MHRTCTPEKTTRNASHTGVGEVTRSISNVARLVDTARSQLAAVRATAPVGAAGPASVLQLPLPLHLHFRHTGRNTGELSRVGPLELSLLDPESVSDAQIAGAHADVGWA